MLDERARGIRLAVWATAATLHEYKEERVIREIEPLSRVTDLAIVIGDQKTKRVAVAIGLDPAAVGRSALEPERIHAGGCMSLLSAALGHGKVVLQPATRSGDLESIEEDARTVKLDLLDVPRVEPYAPSRCFSLDFDHREFERVALSEL